MSDESLPLSGDLLIMRTADGGWYPIRAVKGPSLADQASEHGRLNAHVARVEDINGQPLWERAKQ